MNLFYTTEFEGIHLVLQEEEAKHAIQVFRMRVGDKIHVVDGRGSYYEAIIEEAHKKHCRARVTKRICDFNARPYSIQIAIAPTKNISRFEWFLEKATEIGINRISPILCARSERKVIREDRLNKVLIAAMKQSLKAYLPKLDPLVRFSDFIKKPLDPGMERYIGYIDESVNLNLKGNYVQNKDVCILIGPEGDFTPKEVVEAEEMGFVPIRLGESRLRTETAGIVACQIINFLNGY